jgi:hypothetical protein
MDLAVEMGHNFAPALGGLLLPGGFPGVKTMILVAPLNAPSISVDNANSIGGLGDLMYLCTVMIILIDLGPSLGGSGASSEAAKFQWSKHVILHDDSLPERS